MAASTGNVARDRRSEHHAPSYWPNMPLKANVICYQGSIMCKSISTGYVQPGATATGLLTLGVYTYRRKDLRGPTKNSTGLSAGVLSIQDIEMGVFLMKNSSAGDAITNLDIGEDCFVVDDQTVAKTNGDVGSGATRSRAGRVYDVSADGVFVWFDAQLTL